VYIPEFNRIEDQSVALAFMKANPFAILVSVNQGSPFATHLPLIVDEVEGQIILRGHLAKANPHWQVLENQESLIIFHGPHAYVSPSLYEIRESVPTWNYTTVHVYGEARIFSDEGRLDQVLHDMINTFDSSYMVQWSSLREEYRSRMLKHIVGFEIRAGRLEAKFKLSQNRTKTEQARVMESLAETDDSSVAGVARLMKELGLGSRT
jgi:transcriptional regulator